MKNTKKMFAMSLLAVLAASIAMPLSTSLSASAKEYATTAISAANGNWTYIQNDAITIMFPADGKKPMFLWWYTNDPDNINVVKFKGLIEYAAYDEPYFISKCKAEAWRVKERIESRYYLPWQAGRENGRKMQAMQKLWKIGNATGLHAPYLPFGGSTGRLDGPENVTRDTVQYLSFNFTLVDVPEFREHFQFA